LGNQFFLAALVRCNLVLSGGGKQKARVYIHIFGAWRATTLSGGGAAPKYTSNSLSLARFARTLLLSLALINGFILRATPNKRGKVK
jgi:hypothetical protein